MVSLTGNPMQSEYAEDIKGVVIYMKKRKYLYRLIIIIILMLLTMILNYLDM